MSTPPQQTPDDHADSSALTFGFSGTHGNVSWRHATYPPDDAQLVCGGYLFADPAARFRVIEALHRAPSQVTLSDTHTYRFSTDRDTPADLAAAMLVAGHGQGELTDAGWATLHRSTRLTTTVAG